MAKKLETPCAAPSRGLPCEIKLDFAMGGYTSLLKGFLYAIRDEYGAAAALKIYERVQNMDDRIKNMALTLKDVFKIEGNDIESITKWFKVWFELTGFEVTWFEQSKQSVNLNLLDVPGEPNL